MKSIAYVYWKWLTEGEKPKGAYTYGPEPTTWRERHEPIKDPRALPDCGEYFKQRRLALWHAREHGFIPLLPEFQQSPKVSLPTPDTKTYKTSSRAGYDLPAYFALGGENGPFRVFRVEAGNGHTDPESAEHVAEFTYQGDAQLFEEVMNYLAQGQRLYQVPTALGPVDVWHEPRGWTYGPQPFEGRYGEHFESCAGAIEDADRRGFEIGEVQRMIPAEALDVV